MRKLIRLLTLVGINAVPGGGFLFGGWSATTALMLYWWETFLGTLLLLILFAWYRRATRGREGAPSDAQFRAARSSSLGATMLFTIPQGYFLGAIIVWISQQTNAPLFPEELWRGLAGVSAFVALSFLTDLVHLGDRPFDWLKNVGGGAFSRMIVMQFTIVLGGLAFAMFERPRAMFAVFIACKFLFDLLFWARSSSSAPAASPRAVPSVRPSRQ